MNPDSSVSCPNGCLRATCGPRRLMARVFALLVLAGCSPVLDWREVALPDTPLVAQMPCKPGRFQREIVVAGRALTWFMLSCEAGGVSFGVASADVRDPTQVEGVLAALADTARNTLREGRGEFGGFDLPGATPFRGNASAHISGKRPDGVRVEESLRLFARGTRVYQATAIGPPIAGAAMAPFEEGLRFDLEKR